MSVDQKKLGRKRPAAARVSRSKKQYWRKGADVTDVEEAIAQLQHQKETGGIVADKADDELFQIDRAPGEKEKPKKFTHRQQAALSKISALADGAEEPKLPTFPKKYKLKVDKLPRPQVNKAAKKEKQPSKFDLWETNLNSTLVETVHEAAKDGADFYLKQTKKVQSKVPDTLRLKPSLLKAVEIPDAGASYNPELDEYIEYVSAIAEDEKKIMKKEARSERSRQLAPGESKVTHADLLKEALSGLIDDDVDDKEIKTEDEAEIESFLTGPVEVNPKTSKQRKTEQRVKALERKRQQLKLKKNKEEESKIFRSKKMLKQLQLEKDAHEKELQQRNEKKKFDDMTKRKKLGAGKFEEEDAPFLLTEEMSGSLRKLKPQGNLLLDRMKTHFQKRNIVPIAGEKNSRRLKQRLRFKAKESRSHQEVKIGTKMR
ncbi:unnamed protein product, partial [Mesorhabditis spiculigera]